MVRAEWVWGDCLSADGAQEGGVRVDVAVHLRVYDSIDPLT